MDAHVHTYKAWLACFYGSTSSPYFNPDWVIKRDTNLIKYCLAYYLN